MTAPTQLPDALAPLIALPHWVIWRWEHNASGERTKVPYQAAHPQRKASGTNPATWSDYATALAAAEHADGIGFCLLNSGFGAFDADDCRDAATGALAPWAQRLVARANSYTEITPSGTGVRTIGYAAGPKVHRKQAVPNGTTLETFRQAERYITVTGNSLPDTPMQLADLDALIDTVVTQLDHANGNKAEGAAENSALEIDWGKVQQHRGWLKSVEDLPSDFNPKGRMIVAHNGSFNELNARLLEAGFIAKPYDSKWSSVSLALTAMFKADGRFTAEQIAAALMCALPCNQHITKLDAKKQRRAIERLLSHSYNPPPEAQGPSEDAIALRFAERHADELRYVAAWGHWMEWDGTRWNTDQTLRIFDLARIVVREAAAGLKNTRSMANAKTVAAVERLAKSDRRIAATINQWDADS